MTSRREFLRSMGFAAGAGLLMTRSVLPNVVWGPDTLTVGLQMYTVRGLLEGDFERTLRKVAELGIKDVEFDKYFGKTPEEIRRLIDELGIGSLSKHIDTQTLRTGLEQACEDANTVGQRYLIVGWLPPEERKTQDDYKRLIENLNAGAEVCKKAGIRLGYHNHDFEFEQIEGKMPYHQIVTQTGDLTLELDVYWATKAGRDPVRMLKTHPGRFHLLHLKDMDKNGGFTEVGRGTIDFPAVLEAAKGSGVKHAYIEQDETPGDPFDSVKVSLEFAKSLFRGE